MKKIKKFKWDIIKVMTLFISILIIANILFRPFIDSAESIRTVGEIGGNMFIVYFNFKIGGWLER